MNKYKVPVAFTVWGSVEVDAENEDAAIEAFEEMEDKDVYNLMTVKSSIETTLSLNQLQVLVDGTFVDADCCLTDG